MNKLKKALSIILLVILSISLIGCKTKLERLQDYLNNNNYSDAVSLFKIMKNEDTKNQAINLFNDEIEKTKQEFLDGTVDGTRAISNLQKFREIIEVEDTLDKNIDEINTLMNSQKAFLDGQRAEKENDYALAYVSYYNVIEADKANYEKAQTKLTELKNKVDSSLPATIENALLIINSAKNKKLYPDQMQVLLKNRSNKTIIKFTISILGYDKEGNPVEIQGQNDNYNNYEFVGSGDNYSINPNVIWGEEYGWSLSPNHKVNTIIACIIDLQFSDGTTWNNPLYKPWLEKHYKKTLS